MVSKEADEDLRAGGESDWWRARCLSVVQSVPAKDLWSMAELLERTLSNHRERRDLQLAMKRLEVSQTVEEAIQGLSRRTCCWLEVLGSLSRKPEVAWEYLNFRQRLLNYRDDLRRRMYYPLCVFGCALVSFVIVSLVAAQLQQSITEIQKEWEYAVRAGWVSGQGTLLGALVPLSIGSFVLAMVGVRLFGGKSAWSMIGGSLPLIGKIWRAQAASEFLALFGFLHQAGRLEPEALALVEEVTEYPVNQMIVHRVLEYSGKYRLGTILRSLDWFPKWSTYLIDQAETSKQRAEVSIAVAELLETQAIQGGKMMGRILPLAVLGIMLVLLQYGYATLVSTLIKLIVSLNSGIF